MRTGSEMRRAIVEFLSGPGYRPATARDLMRLLRIEKVRRHEFKRTLRQLLNDEEVVKVGRDRYAAAGAALRRPHEGGPPRDGGGLARKERARERGRARAREAPAPARGQRIVFGRLQRHPRGFGFITP